MTDEIGGIPFPANHYAKFNLTFSSTRLYRYGNITSQPNILFNIEAKTYIFLYKLKLITYNFFSNMIQSF